MSFCLVKGMVLVTDNEKHFIRIEKLEINLKKDLSARVQSFEGFIYTILGITKEDFDLPLFSPHPLYTFCSFFDVFFFQNPLKIRSNGDRWTCN